MALTIYKRGRYWWLTGTVKTRDGEQRVHESTGATDEAAADAIRLTREEEARDALLLGPKATFTFAQAVNAYLDAGKSDRFLKPLLAHFGMTRVADITGTAVRAAAKTLYPDAAYTTWNRQVVIPMKAVVNLSADAGDCPPVKIKGFSKRDRDARRPSTPPRQAVTRAYIDAFRSHCDDPRLSALMLLLFQTGARIGDAIRLEPQDLDLPARKVTFRDMKNGEDGTADLTVELVYDLQQLEPRHGRIFGFKHRWSVYARIKEVCARAKIPYLGTHQPGRHSFATEMIVRNRVDIATTAKKGRWKSKQILMGAYAHGDDGHEVIDRVFGGQAAGDNGTSLAPRPYTARKRKIG